MIEAKTFAFPPGTKNRMTNLEVEGDLVEITKDLATIIREVFRGVSQNSRWDGERLRRALIEVMTAGDCDFWDLDDLQD